MIGLSFAVVAASLASSICYCLGVLFIFFARVALPPWEMEVCLWLLACAPSGALAYGLFRALRTRYPHVDSRSVALTFAIGTPLWVRLAVVLARQPAFTHPFPDMVIRTFGFIIAVSLILNVVASVVLQRSIHRKRSPGDLT